jgi:hypothetical protein
MIIRYLSNVNCSISIHYGLFTSLKESPETWIDVKKEFGAEYPNQEDLPIMYAKAIFDHVSAEFKRTKDQKLMRKRQES